MWVTQRRLGLDGIELHCIRPSIHACSGFGRCTDSTKIIGIPYDELLQAHGLLV